VENKNIPKKEDVIEIHGLDLLFDELIPFDNDFPPKAEATIIQKYSYLGVINRAQTYQYLTKNDDKKITLEQADFFWIMSRGLYSVLYSQNKKKLDQFQGLTTEAKKLAKMCEICIEPDFVKGFLSSPSLHNILSVSDLHDQFYNYLLMGILYQARFELLGLGYKTTEINEQNYTDNINIQLLINNPEKVIQITIAVKPEYAHLQAQ